MIIDKPQYMFHFFIGSVYTQYKAHSVVMLKWTAWINYERDGFCTNADSS